MTCRYKNFGLVKTCNYKSKFKWVITNRYGKTLSHASTLEEAKRIINEIIQRNGGLNK